MHPILITRLMNYYNNYIGDLTIDEFSNNYNNALI